MRSGNASRASSRRPSGEFGDDVAVTPRGIKESPPARASPLKSPLKARRVVEKPPTTHKPTSLASSAVALALAPTSGGSGAAREAHEAYMRRVSCGAISPPAEDVAGAGDEGGILGVISSRRLVTSKAASNASSVASLASPSDGGDLPTTTPPTQLLRAHQEARAASPELAVAAGTADSLVSPPLSSSTFPWDASSSTPAGANPTPAPADTAGWEPKATAYSGGSKGVSWASVKQQVAPSGKTRGAASCSSRPGSGRPGSGGAEGSGGGSARTIRSKKTRPASAPMSPSKMSIKGGAPSPAAPPALSKLNIDFGRAVDAAVGRAAASLSAAEMSASAPPGEWPAGVAATRGARETSMGGSRGPSAPAVRPPRPISAPLSPEKGVTTVSAPVTRGSSGSASGGSCASLPRWAPPLQSQVSPLAAATVLTSKRSSAPGFLGAMHAVAAASKISPGTIIPVVPQSSATPPALPSSLPELQAPTRPPRASSTSRERESSGLPRNPLQAKSLNQAQSQAHGKALRAAAQAPGQWPRAKGKLPLSSAGGRVRTASFGAPAPSL